ncbi:MAG: 4a-hydroxytetrahydrobiopterin dehydratase [Pleurocapsa sp.]
MQSIKLLLVISLMSAMFTVSFFYNSSTANTMVLNETEINRQLQTLSGWTKNGDTIARTFEFKDFLGAIDFVNKLVKPAEAAGHHPDLAISYNKVSISLTTHDAGGITQKDFDLAREISELAK